MKKPYIIKMYDWARKLNPQSSINNKGLFSLRIIGFSLHNI